MGSAVSWRSVCVTGDEGQFFVWQWARQSSRLRGGAGRLDGVLLLEARDWRACHRETEVTNQEDDPLCNTTAHACCTQFCRLHEFPEKYLNGCDGLTWFNATRPLRSASVRRSHTSNFLWFKVGSLQCSLVPGSISQPVDL
jgi:hypothetical protein